MRTITLNVAKETDKWSRPFFDLKPDITKTDKNGVITEFIFYSPMKKWGPMMTPEGTVKMPDMDYYNSIRTDDMTLEGSLKNKQEMKDFLDELKP